MASRPTSPLESTKKHSPPIQPNAHPYAIKTTSSALLSRSNSSPHSAHHTRHHYIPSSTPLRVPTGARARHRHSSSLSSVEGDSPDVNGVCTIPAPLPTPPSVVASPNNSPVSPKRADEPKLSHRVKSAETLSGSTTQPISENHSDNQGHEFNHDENPGPGLYSGLPSNPKQWNTDQLATYLETSFKLDNTANGDKAGMLECVRTRGLTGRELLRLTDADLADTPLSDIQRAQLLQRSRTLRADVLRGRIYVDSYHSYEVSDNSNDVYSPTSHSSTPFHNIRGASVSADDLRFLLDNSVDEGKNVLPTSPIVSLHRSNSVSDVSAQRYRDLARLRLRRRGRVKGLVETWERASASGSECSASEGETESETDPESESISDAKSSPESPSNLPSALHDDEPSNDICSSVVDSAVVSQEPPISTPPPPYAHVYRRHVAAENEEEEPSIEELLESSSDIPLKGARAWEADFALGDTVKRVPVSLGEDAGSDPVQTAEPGKPRHPNDDGQRSKNGSVRSKGPVARRSTGSRRKNARTQHRVVTAIFTGSPSDNVSKNAGDEVHIGDPHRYASGLNGVIHDGTLASSDLHDNPNSSLRVLEESISETRTQLEAFRLRLEKVEADTARQEAMLERVTAVTAAPPTDESFGEDPRNTDFEGWGIMSPVDIARAVVGRAMGWLFPYGRLGLHPLEDRDQSPARTGIRAEADNHHSPVKRNGRLHMTRMSCSIILISFAICAAVLRRMGFGRWVGRP